MWLRLGSQAQLHCVLPKFRIPQTCCLGNHMCENPPSQHAHHSSSHTGFLHPCPPHALLPLACLLAPDSRCFCPSQRRSLQPRSCQHRRGQPVVVGSVSLTSVLWHGDQWGLRECEHQEMISAEVCACVYVCVCAAYTCVYACVSVCAPCACMYVCVWCLSELIIHVVGNRNPKSHFQILILQ